MAIVQLLVGFLTLVGAAVLLFFLATSEINFKDITFAIYFAIFATMSAVAFFVMTRNADNEETNPGKEGGKK